MKLVSGRCGVKLCVLESYGHSSDLAVLSFLGACLSDVQVLGLIAYFAVIVNNYSNISLKMFEMLSYVHCFEKRQRSSLKSRFS